MSAMNCFPDGWVQQTILQPPVIEVRMRWGVIPSQNHCQIQVDALNPVSSELLGMQSKPSILLADIDYESSLMHDVATDYIRQFVADSEPFPKT